MGENERKIDPFLDILLAIVCSELWEMPNYSFNLFCVKMQSTVSGLNRGLVASLDDLQRAETAAKELETAAGPVDLTDDLDKLQGKWRLLYSSAFSSRSLGGSRPGLPTGRLIPVTLGQVCCDS